MSINSEKIFGYLLLSLGLVCIIFAFYSVYKTFTNIEVPPEIFQAETISFLTPSGPDSPSVKVTVPLNYEIRKIVNVFLYYLFMLFIVAVGGKLGNLGIQFIRVIRDKKQKMT